MHFCKNFKHNKTFSLTSADCRMEAIPADDVGRGRYVINDECGERTKQNASHELGTKLGFVKRNVGGFGYQPRGDVFLC